MPPKLLKAAAGLMLLAALAAGSAWVLINKPLPKRVPELTAASAPLISDPELLSGFRRSALFLENFRMMIEKELDGRPVRERFSSADAARVSALCAEASGLIEKAGFAASGGIAVSRLNAAEEELRELDMENSGLGAALRGSPRSRPRDRLERTEAALYRARLHMDALASGL